MNCQNQQEPQDRLQELQERFESEQREFDDHWLWKELGTTPQRFAETIRETVVAHGISAADWDYKVRQQAEIIRTRTHERLIRYEVVNLKRYTGIRA